MRGNCAVIGVLVGAVLSVWMVTGAAAGERDRAGSVQEALEGRLGLLEEFKERLRGGDKAAVVERHDEVAEAVDFLAAWEGARSDLARGIQARTGPDHPAHTRAEEFVETTVDTAEARLALPFDELATAAGSMSAEVMAEGIGELIEAHREMVVAAKEMAQHRHDVELPRLGALYGPDRAEQVAGEALEVRYLLENYGNQAFRNIRVKAQPAGPEDTDVTVEPARVEELEPGDTRTVTLSQPAESRADGMVELVVEGERVRERKLIRIAAGP